MIAEIKLHQIALAHADEQSGNLAAERPEKIIHAVGHALHQVEGQRRRRGLAAIAVEIGPVGLQQELQQAIVELPD